MTAAGSFTVDSRETPTMSKVIATAPQATPISIKRRRPDRSDSTPKIGAVLSSAR